MDVSVIATSYNDENQIIEFLDCIENQSVKPYEVIIADGGSHDRTVDLISEFQKGHNLNIRVVTEGRLNIAQGYNLAIKNTQKDVIVITGIGNKYSPTFLEELIRKSEIEKKDIIYGRIKGQDNNLFSFIYNRAFLCGKLGVNLGTPSNRGCLIKKSVFSQIGFFYENFVYAGEDTEFYRRAKKNNISMCYCYDAVVYWKTPQTLREYYIQKNNYYIGRIQHTGRIITQNELKNMLIALVPIISALFSKSLVVFFLALLLVYFYYAIKRRTTNIVSVFLYIMDSFYAVWLFFKHRETIAESVKLD